MAENIPKLEEEGCGVQCFSGCWLRLSLPLDNSLDCRLFAAFITLKLRIFIPPKLSECKDSSCSAGCHRDSKPMSISLSEDLDVTMFVNAENVKHIVEKKGSAAVMVPNEALTRP